LLPAGGDRLLQHLDRPELRRNLHVRGIQVLEGLGGAVELEVQRLRLACRAVDLVHRGLAVLLLLRALVCHRDRRRAATEDLRHLLPNIRDVGFHLVAFLLPLNQDREVHHLILLLVRRSDRHRQLRRTRQRLRRRNAPGDLLLIPTLHGALEQVQPDRARAEREVDGLLPAGGDRLLQHLDRPELRRNLHVRGIQVLEGLGGAVELEVQRLRLACRAVDLVHRGLAVLLLLRALVCHRNRRTAAST